MESDFQFNAKRMWRICLQCAWVMDVDLVKQQDCTWMNILTDNDLRYQLATAQLLLGTAAQESAFRWERQRSPRWDGEVGGFSKWQVEISSIQATLASLRNNPTRLTRATQFLFADPHATTDWITSIPFQSILWVLRLNDNDYLGALFAREHYRRINQVIPPDLDGQAGYWKEWYNTALGKGTKAEYLANWLRYCDQVEKT